MPRQIHPEKLAEKLNSPESVYLLDVREPWEYEHCRIEGSTLIPLGELQHRLDEIDPPDGSTIVVYCHHGVRSLSGAAILEMNGLGPAFSLSGGIEAWSVLIDPKVPRY